jgi:hypothetical protein
MAEEGYIGTHQGVKKGKEFAKPAQLSAKHARAIQRRVDDYNKGTGSKQGTTCPGSGNRHKIGGF